MVGGGAATDALLHDDNHNDRGRWEHIRSQDVDSFEYITSTDLLGDKLYQWSDWWEGPSRPSSGPLTADRLKHYKDGQRFGRMQLARLIVNEAIISER